MTEVIEAIISIFGLDEAVLGTAPIAQKEHRTLFAVGWQRVLLCLAKNRLLWRFNEF